jgi:hypothetical protein
MAFYPQRAGELYMGSRKLKDLCPAEAGKVQGSPIGLSSGWIPVPRYQ